MISLFFQLLGQEIDSIMEIGYIVFNKEGNIRERKKYAEKNTRL